MLPTSYCTRLTSLFQELLNQFYTDRDFSWMRGRRGNAVGDNASGVTALAVSPKGDIVASGDKNGNLRWENFRSCELLFSGIIILLNNTYFYLEFVKCWRRFDDTIYSMNKQCKYCVLCNFLLNVSSNNSITYSPSTYFNVTTSHMASQCSKFHIHILNYI